MFGARLLMGTCFMLIAPIVVLSGDVLPLADIVKTQTQLSYGSQFVWEVEHETSSAELSRVIRRYEEKAKRPYPGNRDVSKPQLVYQRIVTSLLSAGAYTSRVEISRDPGFEKPSVEEWLVPGDGMCYNTSFANKELTVYKLDQMNPLIDLDGLWGFLRMNLERPSAKPEVIPGNFTLPKVLGGENPQWRVILDEGRLEILFWFDATKGVIRRVAQVEDGFVRCDWTVSSDKYENGVWPTEVKSTLYIPKSEEIQVKKVWKLKEVKIGAVRSLPSLPKLDGMRGIKDMTQGSPVFMSLRTLLQMKKLPETQPQAEKK
ncbi:hypothetical protein [Roseimicrobium sp. ORNL1]|uniref:hypothetical protein n=1 Tax=Roseimicrobium sp. ORNL1 TaxID=2711231 RepID=UPI0013E1E2E0|nr:hypothetical protein [Roseimicrobium sp. ORNL1]QIF02456.1 hypothetical protein G5S37_13280 [Roseimicrobium sp. ORNL1]